MAVKIRLSRIGKKNAPFYRIVAIDSRKKRDGKYIEDLGTYNPLTGELIQFHQARVDEWLKKGAIPSETVERLHRLAKQRAA
jgi:small subunit ribosomal protein S16